VGETPGIYCMIAILKKNKLLAWLNWCDKNLGIKFQAVYLVVKTALLPEATGESSAPIRITRSAIEYSCSMGGKLPKHDKLL